MPFCIALASPPRRILRGRPWEGIDKVAVSCSHDIVDAEQRACPQDAGNVRTQSCLVFDVHTNMQHE
jgi:hypothetical protein